MTSLEPSSLAQGLDIVKMAVEREKSGRPGFGVSRMADELKMERSRVSRLTQELCEIGLLEKFDGPLLRAGAGYFALANSLNRGWVRQARRELRLLASLFHLSAQVSVRLDERVVVLRSEKAFGAGGTSNEPGMVTPTWCTGAGRALLWDHTHESIELLLRDVEFIGVGGPNAAHSVAELLALMERDRPSGFVNAQGEFEHDVRELAMPVRDTGGAIVAALSVVGLDSSFERSTGEIGSALLSSAQRLAEGL
jgi:DNA-binding IclR family transcriptional regulator